MFKLRQSTQQWRRSIKMELSKEQLLEMIQTQQMVVQALTENYPCNQMIKKDRKSVV